MTKEQFKKGDQVVYLPDQIKNSADVEFGFITSITRGAAFVRFWSKSNPRELRTKGNSELVPFIYLFKRTIKPQEEIDELLKTL